MRSTRLSPLGRRAVASADRSAVDNDIRVAAAVPACVLLKAA